MIKIMGKDIKIYLIDPEEGFEYKRYGQADTIVGNIKINKNSSKDIQFQTLLHEIIHFWNEDIGLELDGDNDEEAKIDRLATCIFLLFKENNIDFSKLLKYDNQAKKGGQDGKRRKTLD